MVINNDAAENDMQVTILGEKFHKKKSEITEPISEWISNAIKIDSSLTNCKKLSKIKNISPKIKDNLKILKFKSLFPVQHTLIPAITKEWTIKLFRPHDICVCAPTGSGKTLSYVVPILQLLSETPVEHGNGPRAIVVLPVRDLAYQVHKVFMSVANGLGVRCTLIAGYNNLSKERVELLRGSDVIVCTPGRLVDHIKNTKDLNLFDIQLLVIDEADRVLEDPKQDWYRTLCRHIDLRKKRLTIASSFIGPDQMIQKILLSATLTTQPHLLKQFDLHFPRMFVIGAATGTLPQISDATGIAPQMGLTAEPSVQIGGSLDYSRPDGLTEWMVVCYKPYTRVLFIVDQIRRQGLSRILCFTNTKQNAVRLHALLSEFSGVRCAHLHCEQPPDARRRLRTRLERGELDVLVTVDSMARGIDFVGVAAVIQHDVQTDPAIYVHRVGRTARGGASGVAYAFVDPDKVFHLKSGLARCQRTVKTCKFPDGKCFKYMDEYNAALVKLRQ